MRFDMTLAPVPPENVRRVRLAVAKWLGADPEFEIEEFITDGRRDSNNPGTRASSSSLSGTCHHQISYTRYPLPSIFADATRTYIASYA
jgi:hypothetical protein